MEFGQALINIARRSDLPQEMQFRYGLHRWHRHAVRRNWVEFGCDQLEQYLNQFDAVAELPLNRALWEASLPVMIDYQFGSQDAIHVATALHHELPLILACDRGFARIRQPNVLIISAGEGTELRPPT